MLLSFFSEDPAKLNVDDSIVHGLRHVHQQRYDFYRHTGAILAGRPSCAINDSFWVPAGVEPWVQVRRYGYSD